MRVDAEAEVGDEAVTQVLGGEIVQRRGCDESTGDRGSVVSLVVHLLNELGERRPVSLPEESLVELVGQRCPPLLRWDLGRSGEPPLEVIDALQGFGGGPPGAGVPILDMGEQGFPNRMERHLEAGADRPAAFIPRRRRPGGDDSGCLVLGLIGWQVAEPFVEEPFAEGQCSIHSGDERG